MPESGSAWYGQIEISVEQITETEGFVLRQLSLQVSEYACALNTLQRQRAPGHMKM